MPRDPEKVKAAKRRHYLKHRDEILARVAAYRLAQPEKVKAAQRTAVEAKPQVYRAHARKYYEANREARIAAAKAWAEANPEAHRESSTATRLRRRAGGTLSAGEVREIRACNDGLCAYCLRPSPRLEIEHCTPLARGGVNAVENCVLACRSCNARKNAKTPLEFMLPWP